MQNYSNQVMNFFGNNQFVIFPNGEHMIELFTMQYIYLLDSIIINISEIQAVQLSALFLEHDEVFEKLKQVKMI